ncbi:SCO family protein [Polaribacter sp. MED152]|uniref:SCO family protein n=1 Tax=Polaribacter sp. MED152 TaxID=313598 RepID=UPI000068C9E3|nr:SCO family protein [Polaribacter sp. MED152]EAQ42399.1 SCO2/SenC family protein [Polaribacter sp. MED152]
MKKKYSYVGIAFIILLFGIYAIPKIVGRFEDSGLMKFGKVPDFEFINQEGETITNENYKDKVYVVEFFFSTCPSICPIMNQKMLVLQNSFFGNPEFGIASISITPEIDTPEVLKEYAKNNGITHKNWHLLTGKSEEVVYNLSTKGFKLYVGKGEEEHGGFEHSGLFALVDKDGYIRSRKDELGNPLMYYSALGDEDFPDQMKELKEDIKLLLNE